ncbi:MAG: hypothetical protein [Bacteriophage sp.]|nr:MAG: hypothetical protein [Bacteriophage sp.]
MIYFVNAETKDRIEYDDIENRIFGKKELPIDLNEIAPKIVNAKWDTFYAMTDNKRSGIYKIFDAEDIACYLVMALVDITSLHYAAINSMARGYVSRKRLGIIEPYNGRYGIGYKWYTNCPKSTRHKLVSYLVF